MLETDSAIDGITPLIVEFTWWSEGIPILGEYYNLIWHIEELQFGTTAKFISTIFYENKLNLSSIIQLVSQYTLMYMNKPRL